MSTDVQRFPDPQQTAVACGRQILDWLSAAIKKRGSATLAISGGSSPRPMFESFAQSGFEWQKVNLFWVDERSVPPTDSQSNFKLANDAWLKPGKFPERNIHRIQAELEPKIAAEKYIEDIHSFFKLVPGDLPIFDVIHQGMGSEGHTASLFPGEPLIDDRTRIAAAVWVEKLKTWRITLLPGVLLAGRNSVMQVVGADKATTLNAVLNGPVDPQKYPAQLKRDAVWFVDAAAAAEIR